ncbi:ribosomal protein S18-alanine N-acetyltransferase [Candidatus Cyanaurora vandensis]|uniref:ribosomal protein S18-alanine N-acetyltransferase n=1 Tax=Candidatus Cyanaurora vandensis TaxID=2714958 RepID=UPI00257CE305|nr:ribosomal protein S18-alanine N-acetyltransferase [Candidatus Cyanaurora vandensis]
MSTMSVKLSHGPLTLADLERVVQIEQACFQGYWSRHTFEEELNQPVQRLWALREADLVVAYYGVWRVLDEAHLTTLAVDPPWRGRNLGALALWLALDHCQRMGSHWLILEVRPSNQSALALYCKYGFSAIGRRKQYYPDNEDALVLWLPQLQSIESKQAMIERRTHLWQAIQVQGWEPIPLGAGNLG